MPDIFGNEALSPIDQDLVRQRQSLRDSQPGPRLGDYVLFPTGQLERVCLQLAHQRALQTAPSASFYLYRSGTADASGTFHPAIPEDSLERLPAELEGEFWLFHEDQVGAGRGVTFSLPCRVFTTSAVYCGFSVEGRSNAIARSVLDERLGWRVDAALVI